jgi:GNAT superfamily N-acetyltransferase
VITLRLASAEDATAIAQVHVAGWQHYRGIIPDAYLDRLDAGVYATRWAERMAAPDHGETTFTYAADDPPGQVIGFAYGSRAEGDDPALGEVRAIYVLAERRRDGAGRRLVTALAARLAHLGCRALVI